MSCMLRTWPFISIYVAITAVHTYICFNWHRADCEATHAKRQRCHHHDRGMQRDQRPLEEAVLLHVAMCILHACVVYIVHACVAYIVLGHIVSHTTRYYRSRLILHQTVMPPKPYFRCICRQTLIWKCSLLGFENVAFLGFESFGAAILCTVWLWLHDR